MFMLLTEDHRLIQENARRAADKIIRPHASIWEKNKSFPLEALKELAQAGFMGMLIPEQWGGANLDHVSYALSIMELAKADGGLSTIVSVHNSVASLPILHFGTDEQKNKFLPRLAKGELLGAFALSEPQAGSDASEIQTKAIPEGDFFILTGVKQFVTSGKHADIVIVFAKAPQGITAFVVPTNTPGYQVAKIENKMGQHCAEIAQVVLDNVKIPKNSLLGELGEGYKIALSQLGTGRIGIAAQAIGMAEEALSLSLKYAKERKTFGKFLYEHQDISFKLAEMATQLEAAKQLLFHAATVNTPKEIAMAKLFATEMAEKVCHDAIQIHGGYGYLEEFGIAKLYRDVRATTIYEGSSEIQKLIISRQLFLTT